MSFLFQEVHKEVPYQTERRVCPGDADWDDVRDTVGGSFSPSVIANAFNQVILTLINKRIISQLFIHNYFPIRPPIISRGARSSP